MRSREPGRGGAIERGGGGGEKKSREWWRSRTKRKVEEELDLYERAVGRQLTISKQRIQ